MLRFCLKGKKALVCIQDTLVFFFLCDWSESIEALNCTLPRTKEDEQTAFLCRRECCLKMLATEVAATLYVVQEDIMIIA